MEDLTPHQRVAKIKYITHYISACKLTTNKQDILNLWGADSFDDLTEEQLVECQKFVYDAYVGRTTEPTAAVRRLRSQAMTLLNKLGKYVVNDDWQAVNAYLLLRRICGKLLYMLSQGELVALVAKLRAIKDKKEKKLEEEKAKSLEEEEAHRKMISPEAADADFVRTMAMIAGLDLDNRVVN